VTTDPAENVYFISPLKGLGFPLWVNYVAWLVVIGLVYPVYRWWRGIKQRRHDWWLSYL
jgi:hypothetical protein